ncbi:MAG: nitrile hydratase accessory protein [Gammaproteobacteria bacterium]|nr:nitrile hydratase accessory protein [Gammaproteobacteria bacterium]
MLLTELPSIPQHNDGPVFNAPWEAEAFAMTLTLYEQGVFTWKEWAAELSLQISAAQSRGDPDLGDTYYLHWLAALEAMVVRKKIGDNESLAGLYQDWSDAAQSTPHGQPITLNRS